MNITFRNLVTIVVGVTLLLGGSVMIIRGLDARQQVLDGIAAEKITVPNDEAGKATGHGGKLVVGVATLKAQAEVITHHTLDSTDNLVYAQMPRTVVGFDDDGEAVLDKDGKEVMVPNQARNIWITATSLNTALMMGVMGLEISLLVMGLGALFMLLGFWILTRYEKA